MSSSSIPTFSKGTLNPNSHTIDEVNPLSKLTLKSPFGKSSWFGKVLIKKSGVLFIAGFLFLLALFAGFQTGNGTGEIEMFVSIFFICVVGIPHGSVDHVLYFKQHPKAKPTHFHIKYSATIGANFLLWVFFPVLGYLSFMFISAFHFGESQFSHYNIPKSRLKTIFQFLWGLSILAGMTFFNLAEIQQHMESDASFSIFSGINNSVLVFLMLLIAGGGTVAGLVYLLVSKKIKPMEFAIELLLFTLIHLGLFLLPLVVGFTLYFITLHSFKVLREEFQFLKKEKVVHNEGSFIKMLTPFSLVSIAGVIGLFLLAQTSLFPHSFAYAFLILISCITVPHAHVMHRFYHRK